jgi:hypothetical protein
MGMLSRVMRLTASLPPILLLAISGCLPLYHELSEADAARPVPSVGSESKASERWSPDGRAGVREVHFCVVCAFSEGMHGAFQVEPGLLLPPSQSSTIVAVASAGPSSWRPQDSVSRAPPA